MATVDLKKLRQRRKEAGLTQAELAEKIEVSTMSIRRYEAGERVIPTETVIAIAKALNVPWFDLYEDGSIVIIDGEEYTIHNGVAHGTFFLGSDTTVKTTYGQLITLPTGSIEARVLVSLENLNDKGKYVAAERVEELAKIPDYQK